MYLRSNNISMDLQKHLFNLTEEGIYLNGAYMSPQLKSVEEAGIVGLRRKNNPMTITPGDFFKDRITLKKRFAELIHAPNYENIAIIPSVSYGISNAVSACNLKSGNNIILVGEQFPSNVYPWINAASKANAKVHFIDAPKENENRGEQWNENILNAINSQTTIVAIANVHWADGTLFNLEKIGEKARSVGAKLIIDGTQSVGAMPFDIETIKPDALICAGYKWMMGPYSIGLAYYSDEMCNGDPIEQNWTNRYNSENFSELTNYEDRYEPGAERFSVGGSSNFIHVPMLTNAIEQILKWTPIGIQEYCKSITEQGIELLREKGCYIESEKYRGHHLIGIYLPIKLNKKNIQDRLKTNKITVSFRGDAIRISPHVYNTKEEFMTFVELIY